MAITLREILPDRFVGRAIVKQMHLAVTTIGALRKASVAKPRVSVNAPALNSTKDASSILRGLRKVVKESGHRARNLASVIKKKPGSESIDMLVVKNVGVVLSHSRPVQQTRCGRSSQLVLKE